jgi:hypothetical protein
MHSATLLPGLPIQTLEATLLLVAIFGFVRASPSAFGQSNVPAKPQISVRITIPKLIVTVGEPILVEVRVANDSEAPTFIANSVSTQTGGAARVQFGLTDTHGRISPPVMTMTGDHYSTARPTDVLNSLPYKSWIGNVSTNEISLTVVSPNKPKK